MAGEGKRFKDAGYTIPKPLIEVDGKPMVIKALQSLPKASKNILIVRKKHLNVEDFKSLLNNYFENVIIIEIDYLTEGQASTCLLSESYIPKNSILNIGACDIGFKYDMNKYIEKLDKFDSFIWTYNNNPNVLKKPEMYGWVKTKTNSNEVELVSCKKPISNNLLLDQVVSGTFTFKNSDLFFEVIKKMISENDRVNGEFYLDNVFNHLTNKSSIFKVEKYYSWGTPSELLIYQNEN
jgi:dTDP-glucose pyrophosphorylase